MDGDEVNSISDTTESMQVATIVRTVFEDIVPRANLPEHYSLFSLTPSADLDNPVTMSLPSDVNSLLWVKYNKETTDDPNTRFALVSYMALEDFLNRMYMLNESEDNVDSFDLQVGGSTFTLLYTNDKHPDFYTTFDDGTIVFDSYDAEEDTTLQASKTLCYGGKGQTFTMSDTFVPPLDEPQFALLFNEAKSLAWAELRQTVHSKAEQAASRHWAVLQKTKEAVKNPNPLANTPNYARKR